eukprot:2978185-Alexandrium_andersonii.AAC.1
MPGRPMASARPPVGEQTLAQIRRRAVAAEHRTTAGEEKGRAEDGKENLALRASAAVGAPSSN